MVDMVTIGAATLYHGDCLEVMRSLPSVDHVMDDPPYEEVFHQAMGKKKKMRTDGGKELQEFGFEGIDRDRSAVAKACVDISDGWILTFSLAEGVRAWRDVLQDHGAKYDTCCFWVKPDSTPRMNGQGPARGAECIVTSWAGKGYRSWNGGGSRGIFTHNRCRDRLGHPTQKPVSLMCELVNLFSKPGQTILDPHMGVATTGEACARLGRKFIGIEKDRKWFDIACDRMQRVYDQADMFTSPPVSAPKQVMMDLGE